MMTLIQAPTGRHHLDDNRPADDQTTVRSLFTRIGRERDFCRRLHEIALQMDKASRGRTTNNKHVATDPW